MFSGDLAGQDFRTSAPQICLRFRPSRTPQHQPGQSRSRAVQILRVRDGIMSCRPSSCCRWRQLDWKTRFVRSPALSSSAQARLLRLSNFFRGTCPDPIYQFCQRLLVALHAADDDLPTRRRLRVIQALKSHHVPGPVAEHLALLPAAEHAFGHSRRLGGRKVVECASPRVPGDPVSGPGRRRQSDRSNPSATRQRPCQLQLPRTTNRLRQPAAACGPGTARGRPVRVRCLPAWRRLPPRSSTGLPVSRSHTELRAR